MNQGEGLLENELQGITKKARSLAEEIQRHLVVARACLPEKTNSRAEALVANLKDDAVEALVSNQIDRLSDCLNQDDAEDVPLLDALRELRSLVPRAQQVRNAGA